MMTDEKNVEQQCADFREMFEAIRGEVGRVIVGHEDIVANVLISLFSGGHVLLEGVPGLGKTLLVRTLGSALSLEFRRIQFTPDLMPADIAGTSLVVEDATTGRREFQFQKGPIFGQIILADEINRATPKTQSAMLEAMQEHSVTSGGQVRRLPEPFMVLATQNPIEQEGTYPLPEAQLDRFFFKLLVGYSTRAELSEILNRTTTGVEPKIERVIDAAAILEYQEVVRRVTILPAIQDYAVRLVLASHPGGQLATPMVNQFLRFGASPRAAQTIVLAAKVKALLAGRGHVGIDDLRAVALPALRHRVLLNFEGEADGKSTDEIVQNIIDTLPVDVPMTAA